MASNVVASDTATTSHPPSAQHTTLQSVRRNAQYLLDPQHSPAPDRRRTRTLLRTARYLGVFLFWRLVRYAKYAAVGAATAAVAGTFVGSMVSGVGFLLAPPGILAGAGVGLLWSVGKSGWRTVVGRVRRGDVHGADARGDERADERGREVEGVRQPVVDPW